MPTLRCKLLILLLLFLIALPGCKERYEAAPQVLVRVNGRAITLAQFRQDFARTLPADQQLSAQEKSDLERAYLVQVIDRELTLGEAERLGVEVTPAELAAAEQEYRAEYPSGTFDSTLRERGIALEDWRRELRRGLVVEKVMHQAIDTRVNVSAEDVAAYFRDHRQEFDRPEQVRARQILVASEADGERALAELKQGRPFAEVARELSLSPDAEQGGDLGFFGRGEMPPEFDQVVFTSKPGRVSDLIRSDYGYHLFLVEERRPARHLELDQVREQIRARLTAERQERAYQAWLQDLRSKATIEMNWSLL